MESGAPIVKEAPHEWMPEAHGVLGCYFCRPENFPGMPELHTLCCRCGNLIQLKQADPMNLAMEACTTCIDEMNADSINTTNREGKS